MYANIALKLPNTTIETHEDHLRCIHSFDGELLDEMRIELDDKVEYTNLVFVSFTELPEATGEGTLGYSWSWKDDSDGISYPGYLELHFTINSLVSNFIEKQVQQGNKLHIGVEVAAPLETLYHIGPDDGGEYIWKIDNLHRPVLRLDRVIPITNAGKVEKMSNE